MSRSLKMIFGAATLLASASSVHAGGSGCRNCYQHVAHPAQYRDVAETVLVRPAQSIAHRTPAEYGTVHENFVIHPAHTVARTIPAEHSTVAEQVMVSPARKEWQVTTDAHGRQIGCWVKIPAQYAVQHRTVVVRPAQIVHETIPAVHGTRARQVMVRAPQVHHEVIPPQYATRHRTEMVAPASSSWQPVGGHHRPRHW